MTLSDSMISRRPAFVTLSAAKGAMLDMAPFAALRVTCPVDGYVALHNNTFMQPAVLPVILLNTARSTGATG